MTSQPHSHKPCIADFQRPHVGGYPFPDCTGIQGSPNRNPRRPGIRRVCSRPISKFHAEPPQAGSDTFRKHPPVCDRTWMQPLLCAARRSDMLPSLHPLFASDSPPLVIGTDYLPILDSPSADLQAPIVFVGYGISDPAAGIDEYAGMDVRNKVVLFLRGKPERYDKPVSHADKVRTARAHGAIGLLTATGPILNAYETRRGVTGRPSAFYGLTEPRERFLEPGSVPHSPSAILGRYQPDSTRPASHLPATHQRKLHSTINDSGCRRCDALDQHPAGRDPSQRHLNRARTGSLRTNMKPS